ncbi:MAG: HNH endonuclease [Chloroflexota bacterium]
MLRLPVLVLNQNYQPLNVCRARRAVVLVLDGRAEVVENDSGYLRAVSGRFAIPSVIRLHYLIRRPWLRSRLTKFEIFNRDRYTCQYCGRQSRELTLDHVLPRGRGGEHSWENVVSACAACNRRKAGRTPKEAGMALLHQPRPPHNGPFAVPYYYLEGHDGWHKYFGV